MLVNLRISQALILSRESRFPWISTIRGGIGDPLRILTYTAPGAVLPHSLADMRESLRQLGHTVFVQDLRGDRPRVGVRARPGRRHHRRPDLGRAGLHRHDRLRGSRAGVSGRPAGAAQGRLLVLRRSARELPREGNALGSELVRATRTGAKVRCWDLLYGAVPRVAPQQDGTIAGWDFSPALRASGLVWTEENLNDWLTDPAVFVPESQMDNKVPIRFEREDVIGYIRSVSP